MIDQYYMQAWNDAVKACKRVAMDHVIAMETEASDGMPSPARGVIRAIGAQFRSGDDRNVIHGIDASMFPTVATQRIADAARIATLEGFIRDFAATTFDAMPRQFIADPQDTPDDATDLAAVLAWQDDARDLLKGGK